MRTSERTLLSSMGFADPDKASERHDWACQYIAHEKGVGYRIVDAVLPRATDWKDTSNIHRQYRDVRMGLKWYLPETEMVISSSAGRPIGFIDVVIPFAAEYQCEYEISDSFDANDDSGRWGRKSTRDGRVLVEVKIHRLPVGQAIRQIKAYVELLAVSKPYRCEQWIPALVTAYDLCAEDTLSLSRNGIFHLRLGPDFDDYCSRRESDVSIVAPEFI
jgi:hypothetical protein